jgi:hypothetical protein
MPKVTKMETRNHEYLDDHKKHKRDKSSEADANDDDPYRKYHHQWRP